MAVWTTHTMPCLKAGKASATTTTTEMEGLAKITMLMSTGTGKTSLGQNENRYCWLKSAIFVSNNLFPQRFLQSVLGQHKIHVYYRKSTEQNIVLLCDHCRLRVKLAQLEALCLQRKTNLFDITNNTVYIPIWLKNGVDSLWFFLKLLHNYKVYWCCWFYLRGHLVPHQYNIKYIWHIKQ